MKRQNIARKTSLSYHLFFIATSYYKLLAAYSKLLFWYSVLEVIAMGELRWRERFNTTIPKEQAKQVRELHKKTRIPISKLTEEAFDDLLKKYNINKST